MKRLLLIIAAFPLLMGVSPFMGPTDLGNEAYSKGEYDEALRQYRDAAEARPKSPEAHYNLGNAYYRKGEFDKAAREYAEAARLDPRMADAYYNAGDSLFRLKRYEDALKSYSAAKNGYTKSDPDTEHNIELTMRYIEREKERQRQQEAQKTGRKDEKGGKREQTGNQSARGGEKQQGQSGSQAQKGGGPPSMSNEELQALMERQAREEKRLRGYFRPGEKGSDYGREDEIEQMLRGMGLGALARPEMPGKPRVDRDW